MIQFVKHKKDPLSYEDDIVAFLDFLETLGIKTAGAEYMMRIYGTEGYMYMYFERIKTKITLLKDRQFYR